MSSGLFWVHLGEMWHAASVQDEATACGIAVIDVIELTQESPEQAVTCRECGSAPWALSQGKWHLQTKKRARFQCDLDATEVDALATQRPASRWDCCQWCYAKATDMPTGKQKPGSRVSGEDLDKATRRNLKGAPRKEIVNNVGRGKHSR